MRYEAFFTTLLTISYAYVLINTTVEYIKLLDNSQGIVTKNKNDTEGLLFKKRERKKTHFCLRYNTTCLAYS